MRNSALALASCMRICYNMCDFKDVPGQEEMKRQLEMSVRRNLHQLVNQRIGVTTEKVYIQKTHLLCLMLTTFQIQ